MVRTQPEDSISTTVRSIVPDWRARAACRPYDSEIFFPSRSPDRNMATARAKAVCRECPVREECLKAALEGREKVGIWGGLTPEERAKLNRRNRRAAAGQATSGGPATPPRMVGGYPTREQIRRGVAAGWLRIDAVPAATEARQA